MFQCQTPQYMGLRRAQACHHASPSPSLVRHEQAHLEEQSQSQVPGRSAESNAPCMMSAFIASPSPPRNLCPSVYCLSHNWHHLWGVNESFLEAEFLYIQLPSSSYPPTAAPWPHSPAPFFVPVPFISCLPFPICA